MSVVDYAIVIVYVLGVLGIGYYHFRRNKNTEDYYVGGRSVKSGYVGLSVVATDVGGGFSIGLGGLGFVMGLSGSWLLFTGLVGAWLAAVLIIPKIKAIDAKHGMMTYPDFLRYRFNGKVAMLAALISGIGYLGFTGGQLLAGATLSSATLFVSAPFGMDPMQFSIYAIAVIAIGYTVIGGIKAVIYTDAIQWSILLFGLILAAIPLSIINIGGISVLRESLPPEFFSLRNITWVTFVNWMVTIVPIWIIAMTLYQRMYACKNEKDAKKAWYLAGILEWPILAFMGVFLGMCARHMFPEIPVAQAELGLPTLIREVLPIGLTGIVIAAYFSAIMSTADSCLMASSGNIFNDIIERKFIRNMSQRSRMRLSQVVTLMIGIAAVVLATQFTTVLDAIMYAYAFMVSGLFIPTVGAYFWQKSSSAGAFWGMIAGGGFTLPMTIFGVALPFGLDPVFYGIILSAIVFTTVSLAVPDRAPGLEKETEAWQTASID